MHTSPTEWSSTLASGLTLRGLEWGNADAPVILAVHGWLDNAASFTALGERLKSTHRLIAVDLPGHGRSDHPSAHGVYHFMHWCVWLDELVVALGLHEQQLCLIGHSMGAGVVTCYAGATPRDIAHIFAIDGLVPGTTSPAETPAQFWRGLKSRAKALGRSASRVKGVDEAVERMKKVRMPMSEEALYMIARRHLVEDEQGWCFGYDRMLQSSSVLRLSDTQVRAFIAEVTAPVCVIRASEGWPVDDEMFKERMAWFAAPTTQHNIPGGHHVHMDRPDEVYAIIAQELGERVKRVR